MTARPDVSVSDIAIALGVVGVDESLLINALTHSTAALALNIPSFQRLEFLGDAVLELCVTRALFDRFQLSQEGALTQMRIGYVRRVSLANAASRLHLERYIRVAPADKYTVEADNPKVMADSLEAVIAVVYLSQGLDAADAFIRRLFDDYVDADSFTCAAVDTKLSERTPIETTNWKSALQEFMMANSLGLPIYKEENGGSTHKPAFKAVCSADGGEAIGRGKAATKKQAQQLAAREAYLTLTKETSVTDDGK